MLVAGPSNANSLRIENSTLKRLRASLKEEIAYELKNLLIATQREMLKFLRLKTGTNVREEDENELENETRSFYTPTKLVRILLMTVLMTVLQCLCQKP